MWSANEFFYGSEHGSRPDVHEVEALPRGPYQLPAPVGYSSSHLEDHHERYGRSGSAHGYHERSHTPPYISGSAHGYHERSHTPPYVTGSAHGHHERGHTPPYAGAAPLVGYQHDHHSASLVPSAYLSGSHAPPRELVRPLSPYAEHGNVYAATAYSGGAYAAPVPTATYYDASHGQLPHSGGYGSYAGPYAAAYGETSHSALAASQKSLELRVALCCESCGERIKNGLFVLEGVRAVALDFERQKVSIVGDVNAAKALELVTAIAPGDPTHTRPTTGMQTIMYRNM
eukprot:TRINITY_DN2012_c0_g1_i3.p1 TRINITY_DN2012_c0_g1~~TRINITY_DN2012_c0_g1_i3.p1  ORF type:complete len:287 (+),score=18.01 TRINITY_DN2012_c0_g1_i3:108-968(+)